MVVRKIIERILEVGQTTVTITDTDIPGSLVRTYSNDPDLMPVQIVLTGSTLKIDYEAQTTVKYVAVELVKQGLDIIDNLTSTDTDAALSANQGKVLKDLVDGITPITELVELDDVSATNPQTGDILKYNGTSEKWEKYSLPAIPLYLGDLGDIVLDSVSNGQVLTYNGAYWTNQNPSGGDNYTTDETVIGTWLGETLYRKVFTGLSTATNGTSWVTVAGTDITNLKQIIDAKIYRVAGTDNLTIMPIGETQVYDSKLRISLVSSTFNGTINTAVVVYTKTV